MVAFDWRYSSDYRHCRCRPYHQEKNKINHFLCRTTAKEKSRRSADNHHAFIIAAAFKAAVSCGPKPLARRVVQKSLWR